MPSPSSEPSGPTDPSTATIALGGAAGPARWSVSWWVFDIPENVHSAVAATDNLQRIVHAVNETSSRTINLALLRHYLANDSARAARTAWPGCGADAPP